MHRKAALYLLSVLVGLSVGAASCVGDEVPDAATRGELVTQGAAVVSGASKVTICNLPRYTRQTSVRLCGYTISGSDGAPVASVWFSVDGGEPMAVVPEPSGGFVDTSTALAEGTHAIRLYAQSAAGNLTFEEKTVTVDLTPPTLRVLAPTSDDVMTSTVVNVTSSVSDVGPVRVQTQWGPTSTVESGVGAVTQTVDLGNRGYRTLLVRATDAAGNTTEARPTVYFCLSSDAACFATAHWAPVIVSTFQSSTTVPVSGGVTFRVLASDPQGSPLSYTWTSNLGTLGVPVSDATTSEVVWTPACVPAGTTPTITATVTNALGYSAAFSFFLAGGGGCPPPSVCGDGVTSGPEACDDGNTVTETACPNGQATCSTCNATCTTVLHSLGVTVVGTGTGSISSVPAGITCPTGKCTVLFPKGTAVTLTATPAVSSTFTGWLGGGCSGTGGCLVAMTAAASVSASFSPPKPPVIVSTFQSATAVPVNGGVTFRVEASDPQSSALAFSWKASVGTLGVPSNGSTTSEVVWTPPACVLSGTTASITATVTNAFNLTATAGFTVSGLSLCANWASTGPMALPRYFHTATLLKNGKVLVTGGHNSVDGTVATAEVYDPASGTWSVTGSMGTPRRLHTATRLDDGRVLVAGGVGATTTVATAEVYDPTTGTWSATGPMTTPRSSHTATLLDNGKVLVVAGVSSSYIGTAQVYDPASGTWSVTGAMASPRVGHTATLLKNGKVLVVGGYNYPNGTLASAQVYDPALGTWRTVAIPFARSYHTATLLLSGQVLIAGGSDGTGILATAHVYDPGFGTWSAATTMASRRELPTATLLKNGKVLISGGHNGSTQVATVEVYDPGSGSWSLTGSMTSRRNSHTATLLDHGKVLVVGGFNSTLGILASAELYTP